VTAYIIYNTLRLCDYVCLVYSYVVLYRWYLSFEFTISRSFSRYEVIDIAVNIQCFTIIYALVLILTHCFYFIALCRLCFLTIR